MLLMRKAPFKWFYVEDGLGGGGLFLQGYKKMISPNLLFRGTAPATRPASTAQRRCLLLLQNESRKGTSSTPSARKPL